MGVERGRIEALFLMLGMTQINKSIEIPLFPDEGRDCSALSQTLDRLMFLLMSEIADSSVPFSPTQDLKKNCSGCNYSFICGTQWAAR
jgi:hypothetical protein